MKIKKIITLVVAALLLMTAVLSGCTVEVKNGNDGTINAPTSEKPTDTPIKPPTNDANPTDNLPTATQTVKAIVFEGTYDIPDDDYTITTEETIKFTLYETSPGVYSGGGYNNMLLKFEDEHQDFWYDVYMTWRYDFPNMEHGKTIQSASNFYAEDYQRQRPRFTMTILYDWCYRYVQVRTPEDCTLYIDGNTARLIISSWGETSAYEGKLTELPLPAPDITLLDGNCISINSVFSENTYYHAKDASRILEYRAFLTAKKTDRYNYSGHLTIYGTGDSVANVDDDVRFTMEPFNAGAYRNAGGSLPYTFEAYGVIQTSAGKFIILADEHGVLLEFVGSGIVFGGNLLPETQYEHELRIAEDTKPLAHVLYEGMKTVVPVEYAQWAEGYPPIHPKDFLPPPLEPPTFWQYDDLEAITPCHRWFSLSYNQLNTPPWVLIEAWTQQLSGYDDFEYEWYSHSAVDKDYCFILYKIGTYSFAIQLIPLNSIPPGTSVHIDIY
jgi:hypothetical protein